ncbi:MAG: CBS domain-containing protein [Nitrosopumilus sp.]|nr:CBS domain-containing protein [Nitrosopumilus sp.]MDH3822914.1 CBS domain-containing protein [Nitrosopumilus sp.]MDH3834121.1 CBS domain-containing protein [Nitrosopumilus sp.]
MSTDFITVRADDSLIHTIKKILQMDLNSAIVIENNTKNIPVGIIKLKDLLRTIMEAFDRDAPISDLSKILAKDVMSVPLIYAFLDQPIWDALDLMYSKNISILPVIDSQGEIQGVVRMNSILKNLSEL